MNFAKTALVGINASFSHTALSLYSLTRLPLQTEYALLEFTINQPTDDLYRGVMEEQADLVALSCYIWNIETALLLARRIKAARPETRILLGGPEVSHDAGDWMQKHPEIDMILTGEGESHFPLLFTASPGEVPGLWYREDGRVIAPDHMVALPDLAALPPVYRHFPFQQNKFYYYEGSRGCPYRCAFCLSSTEILREVPMARIKEELTYLLDAEVMLVKFVDRTMNADPERFYEILRFLAENDNGITRFHMEIHPSAMDEEVIGHIARLRKDLVQFEIGVQSTHSPTCRAIRRAGDTEQIRRVVGGLRRAGNVHLHLDLIAGLPYEDIAAFGQSFDDVMEMRPHKLQLGFLKLLRGTELRNKAAEYGIRYANDAPYEVVATNWLTPEELFFIKDIEHILELLYNEDPLIKTLNYLRRHKGGWWALFSHLAAFAKDKGYLAAPSKKTIRFELLLAYGKAVGIEDRLMEELLLYDALYLSGRPVSADTLPYDEWNAEEFLAESVQEQLAEEITGDTRPWFRKTRKQHFCFAIDAYDGTDEPVREENELLFIYKEETTVRRIGKG